ncbi:hypothetical protein RchiOBHm_Chr5g0024931 [Rosa chinensis]|uniref:Uncharacterized protein n=1 Tax=Rosa chinensis TaxID=74649 RepID=A0A2P6Q8E9_ROSCH|nr:hypothetical protein RchiOBHm_Chr5g0024931 [Rosa chinensis]
MDMTEMEGPRFGTSSQLSAGVLVMYLSKTMVTLIQQILVALMQHQQVIQIEVAALVIVRLLVGQIVTVLDSFFCLLPNRTGCRFWNGKLKFIPAKVGYGSSVVYFLTTKSASRSWKHSCS